MRTLYLHIGQGKTGSSFLQASLANSETQLRHHGFEYYQGQKGPASEWKISSGNGPLLLDQPVDAFEFSENKVIFSFEGLFGSLALHPFFPGKLRQLCELHSFSAVRILLFLRNPVAHAESRHQQGVKRGGITDSIETAFQTYNIPEIIRTLLARDLGLPNISFDIFNYDNHRTGILGILAGFLGIPVKCLAGEASREVNRSLSAAECAAWQISELSQRCFVQRVALCEPRSHVSANCGPASND